MLDIGLSSQRIVGLRLAGLLTPKVGEGSLAEGVVAEDAELAAAARLASSSFFLLSSSFLFLSAFLAFK